MIVYSVMVVLVLDRGRGGDVVEDEEIGKMGRWPIRRCELQFTRALGQELSDTGTSKCCQQLVASETL
jgi:hypothetical protein